MKTNIHWLMALGCVVGLGAGNAYALKGAAESDGLVALARMVEAEGEAYVQVRNELLKEHPEPWDVAAASEKSWELGLAAFVLNQRMKEKAAYEFLDNQHPSNYRHVEGYGKLSNSSEANVAFLLEKMWKAPGDQQDRRWAATPEKDREYAYNTLVQTTYFTPVRQTPLWKAIWEKCPEVRLRFIALFFACADPDTLVQPIIEQVLLHQDASDIAFSKTRCISGLIHRDTEETVDAIIGAWDVLSGNHGKWVMNAIGALSMNSSDRARRVLYDFILDEKQPERRRSEVVAKLSNLPHLDDVGVIRRFLAGRGSTGMKADALRWLHRYPLAEIRQVLREVLSTFDDVELLSAAALSLYNAHGPARDEDRAIRLEDATMLEEVLQGRADLPNATRVHIGMYIQGLRAQPGDPRPRLPDRSLKD